MNLGGLNRRTGNGLQETVVAGPESCPGLSCLNRRISNGLKVLLGFCPAFFSFLYTQDWWFLAWCGTFLWFGITGVRNVVQMVMAAKGATRDTLIHWKDQVSVSRLCDSLMYTGISVFLLEVVVRVWLLEDYLGLSAAKAPLLVFTVINIVNGVYICAHNVFRGFPKEAAIGNLFRSGLAIPISSLYNSVLYMGAVFFEVTDPALYLVPSAAVISKMASDTVAALIEGYADSQVNLRMRRWDYKSKLHRLFDCYTRLELLFPDEDGLVKLARPGGLKGRGGALDASWSRPLLSTPWTSCTSGFTSPALRRPSGRLSAPCPKPTAAPWCGPNWCSPGSAKSVKCWWTDCWGVIFPVRWPFFWISTRAICAAFTGFVALCGRANPAVRPSCARSRRAQAAP